MGKGPFLPGISAWTRSLRDILAIWESSRLPLARLSRPKSIKVRDCQHGKEHVAHVD